MPDQPKNIDQLATVINALLEQCQPNTHAVMSGNVSFLFEQVKAELKTGEENAAALEAIKAEQKSQASKRKGAIDHA